MSIAFYPCHWGPREPRGTGSIGGLASGHEHRAGLLAKPRPIRRGKGEADRGNMWRQLRGKIDHSPYVSLDHDLTTKGLLYRTLSLPLALCFRFVKEPPICGDVSASLMGRWEMWEEPLQTRQVRSIHRLQQQCVVPRANSLSVRIDRKELSSSSARLLRTSTKLSIRCRHA